MWVFGFRGSGVWCLGFRVEDFRNLGFRLQGVAGPRCLRQCLLASVFAAATLGPGLGFQSSVFQLNIEGLGFRGLGV